MVKLKNIKTENDMIKVNGRNGISATVIKDSISESGKRFTTFELEYPRIIHGEFMTHRTISKNASSSRAVPIQKAIENVKNNPAFPVHWGKSQNGMQADTELVGEDLNRAKLLWQKGIDQSIELVNEFDEIGAHKQIASRWLETGQMIKVVASATEWDNLLWLRNDDAAQPEFHELAKCLQECFYQSTPELLLVGEYHLPYIKTGRDVNFNLNYFDSSGELLTVEEALKISTSCTAQVSYRRLNDSKEKALDIYGKLFSGAKKHMSPTEHQGTPISVVGNVLPWNPLTWPVGITHVTRDSILHSGNLSGWIQYRQTLPDNVYSDGM